MCLSYVAIKRLSMNIRLPLALVLAIIFQATVFAQTKSTGPIIKDYGKVWKVDQPDFKVDTSKTFKVVFDVANSPEGHDTTNAYIETAARFLNMHAQSGVPAKQLKVALVLHGKAIKDIISNEAYKKRYGSNNPNKGLIEDLLQVGAQVIVCGQSAASRGLSRDEFIDGVQLSLSAMTALIQLQDENYRLIKF